MARAESGRIRTGPIRTATDAHDLARELLKVVDGPRAVALLDANHRVVDIHESADGAEPWHTLLVASRGSDHLGEFPPQMLDWLVVGDGQVTSLLGDGSPWPPPDPRAALEAQCFEAFLDELEADGLLAPAGCRTALLRIEGDEDDVQTWEAAVLDLGGDSIRDLLLGFEAPASWLAIGTVTTGWAGAYDDAAVQGRRAVRPSADPEGRRVAAAAILGRHGGEASRLHITGRPVITTPGPSEGVVPDALRRALGRRTAPPAATTDELFAGWWLEEAVAVASDGRLPWPAFAALHPAVKMLDGKLDPNQFVEAVAALGRVVGWDELRAQHRADPKLAAWMDAGMFSRWMLGTTRPLAAMLTDLRSVAGNGAARRARAVLRALDVKAT